MDRHKSGTFYAAKVDEIDLMHLSRVLLKIGPRTLGNYANFIPHKGGLFQASFSDHQDGQHGHQIKHDF